MLITGSTQIRVGRLCSFLRQEGRENLEPQVLLIPVAVGAPLNHANLVVQSFDERQIDLVAGVAVRHDAVPVLLDQGGEFLKWPQRRRGSVDILPEVLKVCPS
jgi:hypothetical protein